MRRALLAGLIVPMAALHVACSSTAVTANDPYARCVDLGEISLRSTNPQDAQQRMAARAREIGGDTLLFGVRGRPERLAAVPEEIVERRNKIMAPPEPAVEALASAEAAAEIAEPEDVATADGGRRTPKTAVVEVQALPGELWYYGAALRCNLAK